MTTSDDDVPGEAEFVTKTHAKYCGWPAHYTAVVKHCMCFTSNRVAGPLRGLPVTRNHNCGKVERARRPKSPDIGKVRPKVAEFAPELSELEKQRSRSRQNWPSSPKLGGVRVRICRNAQRWPNSNWNWPKTQKIGVVQARMGRCRPTLVECAPELTNLGFLSSIAPNLSLQRPLRGDIRNDPRSGMGPPAADLDKHRRHGADSSTSWRCRSKMAQVGPIFGAKVKFNQKAFFS